MVNAKDISNVSVSHCKTYLAIFSNISISSLENEIYL